MKTLNLYCLFLLCSCVDKNKLPEPTQEGRNTIAMKVDNVVWLPKRNGLLTLNNYGFVTNKSLDKNGNLCISTENESFVLNLATFNKTGVFLISKKFTGKVISENDLVLDESNLCLLLTRYLKNGACKDSYKLVDSLQSQVTITKNDLSKKIVSGTFWMNLYNPQNEIVKITDGMFDIKYD